MVTGSNPVRDSQRYVRVAEWQTRSVEVAVSREGREGSTPSLDTVRTASLAACVEDRDGHLSGGYTEGRVSPAANRQVQREISVVLTPGAVREWLSDPPAKRNYVGSTPTSAS